MERAAVTRLGVVVGAGLCAVIGGAVLAQYIFTMKKKAGRKTKIIEMVSELEPARCSGHKDGCPGAAAAASPVQSAVGAAGGTEGGREAGEVPAVARRH